MEQSHAAAESPSRSGENPTAQSGFLVGSSAGQAESLTTFISDATSNAIGPMRGHSDDRLTIIPPNMAHLQSTIEKLISFQ